MAFDWSLRVPFRYQNNYITLSELEAWLLVHHHPAYVRRLLAWLHYKGGKAGVGGGWRAHGQQPDKPGFAAEGRSFHQYQRFGVHGGEWWPLELVDGAIYRATAVDLVWIDGPDPGDWHDRIAWAEVPVQGSAEAERFGVHCNVGAPGTKGGESWHMQPIEIDGWGSATGNGSHPAPSIDPNYPIPPEHDPYKDLTPAPGGNEGANDMRVLDEPQRIYDSRKSGGVFKPGETRDIVVGADDAYGAVIVNITVDNPPAPGFATAFGGSGWNARPTVSNVNWNQAGGAHENLAAVPVHRDHIHVYVKTGGHVIVDLQAVQARPA